MEIVSVVIVDDEPADRRALRRLLQRDPDVRVVAECADGVEAIEAIRSLRPDIAFLDVEIPRMDGFETLRRIEPMLRPLVVFIAAHDDHALEAFEIHAVDYLRRPYDEERCQQALRRAKQRIREDEPGQVRRKIARVLERLEREDPEEPTEGPIVVRSQGRTILVDVDELNWVEAEANYVRLHTTGRSYLLRESMTDLMKRLDPTRFVRVHRSTIVRRDFIREVRSTKGGGRVLVLRDDARRRMSRAGRSRLESVLGRTV